MIAIPSSAEIDLITERIHRLQIPSTSCSSPWLMELLDLLERSPAICDKELTSIQTSLQKALGNLSGEELLAGIISLATLSYNRNGAGKIDSLAQVIIDIAQPLFSNQLPLKLYESLVGYVPWFEEAVSLFHSTKSKEELVSFCIKAIREYLPSRESSGSFLVLDSSRSSSQMPLDPIHLITTTPNSRFEAAYLISFRLVLLIECNEGGSDALKNSFYKMAALADVGPDTLLYAASLLSLVCMLFDAHRNSTVKLLAGQQRGKQPPPIKQLPDLKVLLGRDLEYLTRLSYTRAIIKEFSKKHCKPERCIPILQRMSFGTQVMDDKIWMKKLDLHGANLLVHFARHKMINSTRLTALLPRLFFSSIGPMPQRACYATSVLRVLRKKFIRSDVVVQFLDSVSHFLSKESMHIKELSSNMNQCLDLLLSIKCEYIPARTQDAYHKSVATRILSMLTELEPQLGRESGSLTEKAAIQGMRALVKRMHVLKLRTCSKITTTDRLNLAVSEKNDIFLAMQIFNAILCREAQQEVRLGFESLSKIVLTGLPSEKHLLVVDGFIWIGTAKELQLKKPTIP